MANLITFDPNTGKVLEYIQSGNTPDYPNSIQVDSKPVEELRFLNVKNGVLVPVPSKEKSGALLADKNKSDDVIAIKSSIKSKLKAIGFTDDELPYMRAF